MPLTDRELIHEIYNRISTEREIDLANRLQQALDDAETVQPLRKLVSEHFDYPDNKAEASTLLGVLDYLFNSSIHITNLRLLIGILEEFDCITPRELRATLEAAGPENM